MNGMEMLKKLQTFVTDKAKVNAYAAYNQNTLIIGMSATADNVDQYEAYRYGMHFFTPKPTNMDFMSIVIDIKRLSVDDIDEAVRVITRHETEFFDTKTCSTTRFISQSSSEPGDHEENTKIQQSISSNNNDDDDDGGDHSKLVLNSINDNVALIEGDTDGTQQQHHHLPIITNTTSTYTSSSTTTSTSNAITTLAITRPLPLPVIDNSYTSTEQRSRTHSSSPSSPTTSFPSSHTSSSSSSSATNVQYP